MAEGGDETFSIICGRTRAQFFTRYYGGAQRGRCVYFNGWHTPTEFKLIAQANKKAHWPRLFYIDDANHQYFSKTFVYLFKIEYLHTPHNISCTCAVCHGLINAVHDNVFVGDIRENNVQILDQNLILNDDNGDNNIQTLERRIDAIFFEFKKEIKKELISNINVFERFLK